MIATDQATLSRSTTPKAGSFTPEILHTSTCHISTSSA